MKKPYYVIYIPGLSDNPSRGQRLLVKLWRFYGVRPHYFQMNWADGEAFEPKLARLSVLIERLSHKGVVSLVGVSAGASAAVNAFAAHQQVIKNVVTVCGKLRNPQTISSFTYRQNPAFEQPLAQLPSSLQQLNLAKRAAIASIKPLHDTVVPPADTIIDGAHSETIATSGHSVSIGLAISLYAYKITRLLRR